MNKSKLDAEKKQTMGDTYSQLNVHCIFAVKGRENFISSQFRSDLHRYMAGILRNDGSYPLAVNGWKDHVHAFFEIPVNLSVSDQMRMLKSTSSKWINQQGFVPGRFRWQAGFGAFSYSRSERDTVIRYIANQEEHHKTQSFREEYLGLLQKFEVPFQEKYLFDFYD